MSIVITAIPGVDVGNLLSDDPQDVAMTVRLVLLLTVLTLAPAFLILMTCFTRIIVVLGFVRMGLATQQMPPTQVLIGWHYF